MQRYCGLPGFRVNMLPNMQPELRNVGRRPFRQTSSKSGRNTTSKGRGWNPHTTALIPATTKHITARASMTFNVRVVRPFQWKASVKMPLTKHVSNNTEPRVRLM